MCCVFSRTFWKPVVLGKGGYQTCQHLRHLRASGLGAPRLQGAPVGDTGGPLLPDISVERGGNYLGEEGKWQVT